YDDIGWPDRPAHLIQRDAHDDEAHYQVRRRGPFDRPAGDEELFVNRANQEKVQVAGADELGEFGAVLQEERFDNAFEGEVDADEEEVLRLRPAGDDLRLREHRPVEDEEDAEPDNLDGQLDEEVAAEGQFAREAVAGQGEQQLEVTPAGLHAIPRTR